MSTAWIPLPLDVLPFALTLAEQEEEQKLKVRNRVGPQFELPRIRRRLSPFEEATIFAATKRRRLSPFEEAEVFQATRIRRTPSVG